jgi:hypothetical protein
MKTLIIGFAAGVGSVLLVLFVQGNLLPPATYLDCIDQRAEIMNSSNRGLVAVYCRQFPDKRRSGQ